MDNTIVSHHQIYLANSSCTISSNGKMISLILNGHNIIIGDQQDYLGNGSYLMFPWVNRISTQDIKIHGQPYKIQPQYLDSNGIALHGLYANSQRVVTKQTENSLSLTAVQFNEHFPTFIEVYTLTNERQLDVVVQIINSKGLPYGIGYHPYFTFHNIDECRLQSNLTRILQINEQMLPKHDNYTWDEVDLLDISLLNRQFDNTFTTTEDRIQVDIIGQSHSIRLSSESLKYCQIYTPGDRKLIAIEPQSVPPDQFKYNVYQEDEKSIEYRINLL